MEVKIQIPDNCELIKDGDTYIVKEKKQTPPRSWEEFCKNYPVRKDEVWISDGGIIRRIYSAAIGNNRTFKNWITTKEEAEAFLALMQLRQLRKAWIGNWDFETSAKKYACNIVYFKNKGIVTENTLSVSHPLNFPDAQIAEEFLTCFKDLCEKAKILL